MPSRIRVLDAANRTMQRLGFLKTLCHVVAGTDTSNLESLGKRLIDRVTRRVRVSPPFEDQLQSYVKQRLTDGTYHELRKAVLQTGDAPVSMEIQDLYLADTSLPSRTGKLVEANRRRYPYLGTSIGLIKKGTYSALTRSFVLLALTPDEEIEAFKDFDPDHNPLLLSDPQAIVLLYSLIDNDAEVLFPLFEKLLGGSGAPFDERTAGGLLPDILDKIIKARRGQSLTPEERDRLALLTRTAANIAKWKNKAYTGGSALQEAITVRLEPYCDLGLLTKPNPDRYEWQTTDGLRTLWENWGSLAETDRFLDERFFAAFAAARGIAAEEATDEEATSALAAAGEALKSSLGYSPITDVGLLAGAKLLTEEHRVLELHRTLTLLKSLQKQDPEFVRFTVDRMGALAFVKFLKPAPVYQS
jgi:hypothetical protein